MFFARDNQAKKSRRAASTQTRGTHVKQDQEIEELKARTAELDRVAKILVRRDLELSEVRERQEQEFKELTVKTTELEDARRALLNILADTEQARGQAEQERKKVELILSNLSDGLLVFDAARTIEFINPQAERILNVKSSNVVGKHLNDVKILSQFSWLKSFILKEHNGETQRELSLPQSSLVFEVTAIPLQYKKVRRGVIVVFHDISREKRIELLKTEFVSLAAHQLRTPLAAVKWSTQMLLDGDEGPLLKDQSELLVKSLQATERMIRLINDLLNVTRIEEGRYLYQPSLQQLGDIVKDMVKSYQDVAKKRKIHLELKMPEEEISQILMDVEKIQLVVQNLLENALHYTSSGGKVTVQLTHDTKEVRVSFKDTGIGIPKEQQQRVFEKFFRAVNARKVDTNGSGLGLYLAYNIVEAHGGKIWFESEEEKGTTFTFSLPIKEKITKLQKKF